MRFVEPVSTFTSGAVTINWTAVPGATGYNLAVAGALTANVNLPASVTNIVVTAPPGSYQLAVRGTAGSQQGPLSNVASVTASDFVMYSVRSGPRPLCTSTSSNG